MWAHLPKKSVCYPHLTIYTSQCDIVTSSSPLSVPVVVIPVPPSRANRALLTTPIRNQGSKLEKERPEGVR